MQAIRKIVRTEDNTLSITLPDDFCHKNLELIILPFEGTEPKQESNSKENLKNFLINLPVMTDEQYEAWEKEGSDLFAWLKS